MSRGPRLEPDGRSQRVESDDVYCCACGTVIIALNQANVYVQAATIRKHTGDGHGPLTLGDGMAMVKARLARSRGNT